MKNFVSLVCLVAALGCQTSKPSANLDAIPALKTPPSALAETETKSKTNGPDIRFAMEKNLIGKTEAQVKGLIGIPKKLEFFGCRTNVQGNEVEIDVIGEQWSYEAVAGNYSADMDLCVFRGKVIAQQLLVKIEGNGRIDVRTRSTTDHKLIQELLLDKTKTDKDLLMKEELETRDDPKKDL